MGSDSDSKPDGYIVLCRTFHIVQTRTPVPTVHFCTGQESVSDCVPESISGSVNELLWRVYSERDRDLCQDRLLRWNWA